MGGGGWGGGVVSAQPGLQFRGEEGCGGEDRRPPGGHLCVP